MGKYWLFAVLAPWWCSELPTDILFMTLKFPWACWTLLWRYKVTVHISFGDWHQPLGPEGQSRPDWYWNSIVSISAEFPVFSRRLGSEAIERLPNDYITLNKTSDFPGFETFWKNWVFYKCTTQTDTEYSSSFFWDWKSYISAKHSIFAWVIF